VFPAVRIEQAHGPRPESLEKVPEIRLVFLFRERYGQKRDIDPIRVLG
jgi:hypothetical protein